MIHNYEFITAALSCEVFTDEWLHYLIEDSKREENEEIYLTKLIKNSPRNLIWNLAKNMELTGTGVAPQASRLLEKYLLEKCRTAATLHFDRPDMIINWSEFKNKLYSKLAMTAASCVQICAKMHSVSVKVTPKLVQDLLIRIAGITYTIDEIKQIEFDILKTIEFKIPIWTTLEMAEMMCFEIGLSKYKLLGAVLEFAEFLRNEVQAKIQWTADMQPTDKKVVNSLHLAAAAVAVAAQLTGYSEDVACFLADKIKAPPSLITCLRDVILLEFHEM